jgi:hypothetical protein
VPLCLGARWGTWGVRWLGILEIVGRLWKGSISLKRLWGGGLGGGSSFNGDSGRYAKKVSRCGHLSLRGVPFPSEGDLVCGGTHIPGTLMDEWRRPLVVGHLPMRDSIKGTLGEGSFTGEPKGWGFWEIWKMPCKWASFSIGALLGSLEGVRLLGLLKYLDSFLGPGGH